jgi:sialate O-acetylesterase
LTPAGRLGDGHCSDHSGAAPGVDPSRKDRSMIVKGLLAGAAAVLAAGAASAAPTLDGVLSDHAVVQRDRPLAVAGRALPGEAVTVTFRGTAATGRADRTGRFSLTLPASAAGGPFDLHVSAPSGATVIHDLLVGDVFLCSGQSNMEMPVERMGDSFAAQMGPGDDGLRLLTVAKATALAPLARFDQPPAWAAAGPKTSPGFSAACLYMAQALRKEAKVPVGAIHSSWGGSQIAAWMGDDAQRAAGRTREADLLRLYARDPGAASLAAARQWEDWWRARSGDAPGREPWQPDAALAWRPVPRIAFYEDWGDPRLATFLGMLWYRTEVTLTPAQARGGGTLELGLVDDADQTWINGKPVGGTSNWSPRVYAVPAGVLKPGRNVLVVNVQNAYATGGMPGPAEAMRMTLADGSTVPLGGGWQYAVVDTDPGTTPRVPWGDITSSGMLYNAMIAPLGATALAGVAWYQGESDTGMPGYADRLRAMMAAWRRQFGRADLPFAIVALSAYGPPATAPGDSGWAYIRDTQRRVAEADGHAALVQALDIGDPFDIHPGEKHEVGRRLAKAMAALVYRAAAPASGPRAAAARAMPGGGAAVRFADVAGALHARSAATATGFELCGAAPASCRYAAATVAGDTVTLAGDGRPVARVRYAWADYPVVNLADDDGLPPGTFELPVR